jgi:hypothetical protein
VCKFGPRRKGSPDPQGIGITENSRVAGASTSSRAIIGILVGGGEAERFLGLGFVVLRQAKSGSRGGCGRHALCRCPTTPTRNGLPFALAGSSSASAHPGLVDRERTDGQRRRGSEGGRRRRYGQRSAADARALRQGARKSQWSMSPRPPPTRATFSAGAGDDGASRNAPGASGTLAMQARLGSCAASQRDRCALPRLGGEAITHPAAGEDAAAISTREGGSGSGRSAASMKCRLRPTEVDGHLGYHGGQRTRACMSCSRSEVDDPTTAG